MLTLGLSLGIVAVVIATGLVFARPKNNGPAHPDEWDSRITGLVRFVEQNRGLHFEEPVFVDFLSADEYAERARSDREDLSAEEQEEFESAAGQLRALGLMTGDVDLFEAGNDLADAGTSAFYDPETDRVAVRGTDLTIEVKVTLVHELTHALQDQHFDVGRKREAEFETSGESEAFRALVEGDAMRVEGMYIDSLSEEDQATFFDSNSSSVEESKNQLTEVPSSLQALMLAPYIYGRPFVSLVFADGGQDQLDEAFTRPPVDDEQEIDPRQFVDDSGPLDVITPSLPDGVKEETDSGDFGALAWFLTLAERIPPLQALHATDGWGGDAYVAYEQSGRTCIRIAWRGDTEDDRSEMLDALDAWTAAMPNDAASVHEEGEVLRLDACDPGKDSNLEISGRSLDALRLIEMRSYLMLSAVDDGGLSVDAAFDFGQCVVERVPFDVIVQAATVDAEPSPTVIAAAQGCSP